VNWDVSDFLSRMSIVQVWAALGGGTLRHNRGQAFWRKGDGFNVALTDAKGTWFDHVAGEGGGILALVSLVRGGSHADALRWLADLAGVPMQDTPTSAADRARWARERRELEQRLPAALYWRRAAVGLGEEVLMTLKAGLFDPTQPPPAVGEIGFWTGEVTRLQRMDGGELVAEFLASMRQDPRLTTGMVRAMQAREKAEVRAILRYLRAIDGGAEV